MAFVEFAVLAEANSVRDAVCTERLVSGALNDLLYG